MKRAYDVLTVEVSEDTLEFLRKQAWAQIESNQLRADELAVERGKLDAIQLDLKLRDRDMEIKRQIENRRDARLAETISRYSELGEQVRGLVDAEQIANEILREGVEAFSAEIRIIKRGLYALLSRDGSEIKAVKQELQAEFEREKIQELLIKQRRNLYKLKQQHAEFGLAAPVHLLNQIEDTEREIERLQEQLNS